MSYWDRTLAKAYRLRADQIENGRPLSGERPQAVADELRQRAAAIDPGADVERPETERPLTFGEYLRGIRDVDGEVPRAADWVQPTGAHDAVPLDAYRYHNGRNWRSKIPANTTEPGSDPRWWSQEDPVLDPEPEEPLPDFPAWQPGIAVKVDERYTYNGRVYRVIQAHTTQAGWTPPAVPALFADEGPAL